MKFALKRPKIDRRLFARVLVLAMSIGLSVAVCEIVVRVVAPQPAGWLAIYRADSSPPYALERNVRSISDNGESRVFVYTDQAGHRTSAYRLRQNKAEAARVLVIGDSFAFGFGVDYEDTFVGLLDGSEERYQFTNAGVPGYGPTQYRQVLEREIENGPSPRLVIVATFLGNDIYDPDWINHLKIRDGVLGDPGGLKSWIKRQSHLYRLITRTRHQIIPARQSFAQVEANLFIPACWEHGDLERGILIYQQEFLRMAEICARRKISLCACIIPTANAVEAAKLRATASQSPAETLDYDLPARKVRSIFEKLGIPYVDTTSALAKVGREEAYFRNDGHLTPLGHRIVAAAIRTHLLNSSDPVEFGGFRQENR